MIKLIASDMDGTLLTPEKELPPGFEAMVRQLNKQGVTFVAGSGRTFSTLSQHFAPLVDEMEFICDNGAYIVENGQTTFISVIERALVLQAVALVEALGENVHPVLCGKRGLYTKAYRGNARLSRSLESSFAAFTLCEDFATVDDDVFKIAVCDVNGAKACSLPVLSNALGDVLQVTQSGKYYVDMMNSGISKGAALAHLQRARGISPQETMAFGDYFNDVDMLACAQYSFVMENAVPEMFAHGNYCAPSNAAHGVAQIIRRYVLEGKPLPPPHSDGEQHSAFFTKAGKC